VEVYCVCAQRAAENLHSAHPATVNHQTLKLYLLYRLCLNPLSQQSRDAADFQIGLYPVPGINHLSDLTLGFHGVHFKMAYRRWPAGLHLVLTDYYILTTIYTLIGGSYSINSVFLLCLYASQPYAARAQRRINNNSNPASPHLPFTAIELPSNLEILNINPLQSCLN
jgi:hypothetical protein